MENQQRSSQEDYGKCPKISFTKVDKMAYTNSEDPDQTAPASGAVWSGSYTVCHSTKYFKKQLHKKQNLGKKKYGIKCLKV